MFNFKEMDLSGVKASGISNRLRPGNYLCHIAEAKIEPLKSKNGYSAKVVLMAEDMAGEITTYFNVAHKSEEAQRIGREQFKGLLVASHHPNPDNPGDVASLLRLKVGVRVEPEEYTKDGKTKMGTKVAGFFDPAEFAKQAPVAVSAPSAPAKRAAAGGFGDMADDIPF